VIDAFLRHARYDMARRATLYAVSGHEARNSAELSGDLAVADRRNEAGEDRLNGATFRWSKKASQWA
jgi:hypothetical protein